MSIRGWWDLTEVGFPSMSQVAKKLAVTVPGAKKIVYEKRRSGDQVAVAQKLLELPQSSEARHYLEAIARGEPPEALPGNKEGPEKHQQAEESPNPSQGTDSSELEQRPLEWDWPAETFRERPSRFISPERPVSLVDTALLMERFDSADRLFQQARSGGEPWALMFRGVKNVEAWFKEQFPEKDDWSIQVGPKPPQPQRSYRLEQYGDVETRLWRMLNTADGLCKDHAVTTEQEQLYFKFTRSIQSIGRMHEELLPGAGSPNVFCGSSQLYHRMRDYAPNAAMSIIMQMKYDEVLNGTKR